MATCVILSYDFCCTVKLRGKIWALWAIADVFVIAMWVLSQVIASIHFRRKQQRAAAALVTIPIIEEPDEIRFAYGCWITYTVFLIPRVVILFRVHGAQIHDSSIGSNYLKVRMA